MEFEAVVLFNADGGNDPRDIARLLLALEQGNDMAVASRFAPGAGRTDPQIGRQYRSIGHRLFTLLANLLFLGTVSDTLSMCRAVRHRRLQEVDLREEALPAFYRLSIHAMRRGWKTVEIPVVEVYARAPGDWWRIACSVPALTRVAVDEWRRARKGS